MKWSRSAWVRLRHQSDGYPLVHRVMRWAVLVLCLVQVPTAWAIQRSHMAHLFPKPRPFDLFLHQVHAWSGCATLMNTALDAVLIALPVTGTIAMRDLPHRAASQPSELAPAVSGSPACRRGALAPFRRCDDVLRRMLRRAR